MRNFEQFCEIILNLNRLLIFCLWFGLGNFLKFGIVVQKMLLEDISYFLSRGPVDPLFRGEKLFVQLWQRKLLGTIQ